MAIKIISQMNLIYLRLFGSKDHCIKKGVLIQLFRNERNCEVDRIRVQIINDVT